MKAKANRHPVDALAEIRAELKTLTKREEALRAEVLTGQCSPEGEEHVATIRVKAHTWVDRRALIRHFGAKRVEQFLITKPITILRVSRKEETP